MDTKLATKQIRLNEWAGIIKDCKASGLKVDQYCSQHNLSRDAYYYWLRKVKEAALHQAGFVELPAVRFATKPGSADFTSQMIIRVGDADLHINQTTPPELIKQVLEMIHHA